MEEKIKHLLDYCLGMVHKEDGKTLYMKYLNEIQSITPQELVLVQYEQLKMGLSPKELLSVVDKLINVFYKALSNYPWEKPERESFLGDMMAENAGLLLLLEGFKPKIKTHDLIDLLPELRKLVEGSKEYNAHLLKIENILFPMMEKKSERYDGLKIMWSLHDELRALWKTLDEMLGDAGRGAPEGYEEAALSTEIGRFYFLLYGLVQKQELILFPAAAQLLDGEAFRSMRLQSLEYAFSYIDTPTIEGEVMVHEVPHFSAGKQSDAVEMLKFATGHMDFEQLGLLLDHLPVDMTLVDEFDKVAFFSRPKDRIFPRSVAVIGRDVRNCHPPESVHVVEDILKAFKEGTKSEASFWIQMRGMFIHIQYFALRNTNGEYRGTLEVSQEISGLRALEGQRRLLEW
ncbi:MAG: PAS domain-containing protein [Firmicutes bacterium]|nr:PAS domain-containing protein [Bacillota bacterium]